VTIVATRPEAPVLVVEDEPTVRDAMISFLENDGYNAVGAGNGEEAFDLLRRGLRPCMILLDLGMPVMDGKEFRTEQVRHEPFAMIPVVVFSGLPDAEQMASSLCAVAALKKPVNFDRLLRLLEEHCTCDTQVARTMLH